MPRADINNMFVAMHGMPDQGICDVCGEPIDWDDESQGTTHSSCDDPRGYDVEREE